MESPGPTQQENQDGPRRGEEDQNRIRSQVDDAKKKELTIRCGFYGEEENEKEKEQQGDGRARTELEYARQKPGVASSSGRRRLFGEEDDIAEQEYFYYSGVGGADLLRIIVVSGAVLGWAFPLEQERLDMDLGSPEVGAPSRPSDCSSLR